MRNLFSSFLATLLIQVMTVVSGVLTARLLLAEGKGELTTVVLWPTLLTTLGSLGIWDAIVFHAAGRDKPSLRPLFTASMLISAVISTVLMAVGYLILPHVLAKHGADLIGSARLYLWFIPLTFATVSAMGFFQGTQSFGRYNIVRTLVYVCELSGIVALWAVGRVSVQGVILVFLAARIVTAIFAIGLSRDYWRPPAAFESALVRPLLGYGTRTHIGTIADALNLRLDQLLMSVFLPTAALGLYVVAVSVGALGSLIASSLNIVLFPRLASAPSDHARWELLGCFMRVALVFSVAATVVLLLCAPWLIQHFFGRDFLAALPSARVLIAATIILNANIILVGGAKAFNFPVAASQAQIVGLAFTGVFLYLLLPQYQGYGAAWASLAAYAGTFFFLLWSLRRRTGLPLSALFIPTTADRDHVRRFVTEVRGRLFPAKG